MGELLSTAEQTCLALLWCCGQHGKSWRLKWSCGLMVCGLMIFSWRRTFGGYYSCTVLHWGYCTVKSSIREPYSGSLCLVSTTPGKVCCPISPVVHARNWETKFLDSLPDSIANLLNNLGQFTSSFCAAVYLCMKWGYLYFWTSQCILRFYYPMFKRYIGNLRWKWHTIENYCNPLSRRGWTFSFNYFNIY